MFYGELTTEIEQRYKPLLRFRSIESWDTGRVFPLLFIRVSVDERYMPVRNCTLVSSHGSVVVTGTPVLRSQGNTITIANPDDIVILE